MSRTVKILVVDDIEQNIVALEALVARPDLELLRAYSGAEALELLLDNDVALALVDVQMPGMDGFELAEFMRGSPRTRHVPIIFLTATDRNTHRTFRGYEAGAVDFLYKPFDPHILRSKIEVFVQLQHQKLQLAEQLDTMTQLLRTNEMFVAVLGHDLRNPLSAIVNTAEVLLQVSAEPRVKTAAARIRNSGGRMSRMVDQLLDIARVRSGRLELSPERVDLTVLLEHIVEEFELPEGERRVELAYTGDTFGEWDADRLSQVVSNLVGNALQHGAADEGVSVKVDGTDTSVVKIAIRNAGTIPAEVQANIFQPFNFTKFRRDGGKGLGLGLYIAKELVRSHHGEMSVCSDTTGHTVFTIHLPRHFVHGPVDEPAQAEKQWVF
ncbi:hybrid sensor histidine kinase/response regulator [Pigmentiphaga litoralis]|jgi:signal transduction histidine kinase|uniref:ATP-binding response regulator n=1 Tax=Pigmentiphaga litoralis TaxID=516702 RepID=UPI00167A26E3|nr:hybrid sensor histidine kinase/response regulator [Pigmentiphaga litoralis]GGX08739.1 hybrid sensor histidine kinase/response regulator [Pigmentiphaga litoralis]